MRANKCRIFNKITGAFGLPSVLSFDVTLNPGLLAVEFAVIEFVEEYSYQAKPPKAIITTKARAITNGLRTSPALHSAFTP